MDAAATEPLLDEGWELPDVHESQRASIRKDLDSLWALYKADRPMYPRSTILDVARQIEARAEKIVVKGWDGETQVKPYDWGGSIEQGTVVTRYREDLEKPQTGQKVPELNFKTFQSMVKDVYDCCVEAKHPLRVVYRNVHHSETQTRHTVGEIMHDYRVHEEEWLKSNLFAAVRDAFGRTEPAPTQIIGFGLGSPDRSHRSSIFFQHLAVESIASAVKKDGNNIRAYCQDPVYTATDHALLNELGIDVLDHPYGFLQVSPSSIVVSSYPDVPVKQIVADDRTYWPAAVFWNSTQSFNEEKEWHEQWSDRTLADAPGSRVREMMKHYERMPLPEDKRLNDGGMELHIRRDLLK